MEIIPLLPSLKEDGKVAIKKRGEWISNQQNTLGGLVESLKIASDHKSTISSIPDVWARAILFENILFDMEHPLHEQYEGAWRGLLAFMALYKYRGYDKTKLYSVEIPKFEALDEKRMPAFLVVLARSLPESYKLAEEDKTLASKADVEAKIQIVAYDEVPIGIVWPSILICPAVDLQLDDRRKASIEWWKANGFVDPIDMLSHDERIMLLSWLKKLRMEIDEENRKLIKPLTNFEKDISARLGTNASEVGMDVISTCDGLPITGRGYVIAQPIQPSVNPLTFLETSHILLKGSAQRRENQKQFLILASDIETQWNHSPNEIMAGGTQTIASALRNLTSIAMGSNKIGELELEKVGAEIRLAESFLTEAIGIVNLGLNAFPNSMFDTTVAFQGRKVQVIPPVKKELLDYLTPQEITENLTISAQGDEFYVELKLPVSGMTDRDSYIVARKIYSLDGQQTKGLIMQYDNVPLLQVWPNFILSEKDRWKEYYTYYDAVDSRTFYAAPVWNEVGYREIDQEVCPSEVRQGTEFPMAFSCYEPRQDNWGKREYDFMFKSGQNELEIGLILLSLPKEERVNTVGVKASVGIDFGTTNTVAYKYVEMSGGNKPELIKIKNRMYYVCNNMEDESGKGIQPDLVRNLRLNFLSHVDQPADFRIGRTEKSTSSISTIYHSHYGGQPSNEPLLRGNIYYFDNYENVDRDKNKYKNSLHTLALKWENGNSAASEGQENRNAFLTQLVMQCLAEVVLEGSTEVSINYSYPQAFTRRNQRDYGNMWSRIQDRLSKMTSIKIQLDDRGKTESLCFAKYFVSDMDATPNSGIICFDIGGGSTDIVIWEGDETPVKFQTSLRIAGGSILGDYLFTKLQKGKCPLGELRRNGEEAYNAVLDKILEEKSNKTLFMLRLETLLKYFDEQIHAALDIHSMNPEVSKMTRDIAFALSGIIFYTGYLVGYLRKEGIYKEKRLLPMCYFGGNASKLLYWVSEGLFNTRSLVCDLFEACLKRGIQMADSEQVFGKGIGFCMSQKPKQEVAYGLVVNKELNEEKVSDENDGYIAGEDFIVSSTGECNKIYINQIDFKGKVQIDQPRFFEAFVTTFNKECRELGFERVSFTEEDFTNILRQVNQELSDIAKEAEEEIKVEPLFIILLKHALKYLALNF